MSAASSAASSAVPAAVRETIVRAFPQFGDVLTVGEFQELLHHRHHPQPQQSQSQPPAKEAVVFIMSSFCRDELATDTAENAHCAASGQYQREAVQQKFNHKHTADHFQFGGLAGVCSCGDTAYAAAAHHVPTDPDAKGVLALAGGPHISFRELSGVEVERLKKLETGMKAAAVKAAGADANAVAAAANARPLLPEWTEVHDGGKVSGYGYWGSMYRAQMTGNEGSACGAIGGYVNALALRVQERPQKAEAKDVKSAGGAAKPKLPPSDPEQNELARVMNQQLADDALAGETYLKPLNEALRLWDADFHPPAKPKDRAEWERSPETAKQRANRANVMRTVTRAAVDASARNLPLVAAKVQANLHSPRAVLLIDCLAVHWNKPNDPEPKPDPKQEPKQEPKREPWQTPHGTKLYVAVREHLILMPDDSKPSH